MQKVVPIEAKAPLLKVNRHPFIDGQPGMEFVEERIRRKLNRIIYVGPSPNSTGGNDYVVLTHDTIDEEKLRQNFEAYYGFAPSRWAEITRR